jgi:hypothetical protein
MMLMQDGGASAPAHAKGRIMHCRRFRAPEDVGPTLATPGSSVSAFVVCPWALQQGWVGGPPPWWHEVYRVALERAQAVLRPSRWERWMKPVWN